MKKMIRKAVDTVKTCASKVKASAYAAMFGFATVLASATGYALPDENISAEALVTSIAGWIVSIFRYIGILLLIWGIGQLILAFKNEDGDSKSRAMMMVMVAVFLITLKTILTSIGIL